MILPLASFGAASAGQQLSKAWMTLLSVGSPVVSGCAGLEEAGFGFDMCNMICPWLPSVTEESSVNILKEWSDFHNKQHRDRSWRFFVHVCWCFASWWSWVLLGKHGISHNISGIFCLFVSSRRSVSGQCENALLFNNQTMLVLSYCRISI